MNKAMTWGKASTRVDAAVRHDAGRENITARRFSICGPFFADMIDQHIVRVDQL